MGMITTSFPRWPGDPAGNFVFGLARALKSRGHLVEVVVPEPMETPRWRSGAGWLEGIRVVPARYAWPRQLSRLFYGAGVLDNIEKEPWRALLIPQAMASMSRAVHRKSSDWDGIVSHWLIPSAVIANLAAKSGKVHVAMGHSGDVHLLRRLPWGGEIAGQIVRSADHVGFVSGQLRQEFMSVLSSKMKPLGDRRTSVMPMGIDRDELATSESRDTIRKNMNLSGYVALFLGRLVPIKGLDILIDALEGLNGAHLVVAGDGPLRGKLEQHARDKGVRASFLGWVDQEKRAQLLGGCDAVVLPSRQLANGRHEGLPLVLVEALAVGRTVVASATGAIPELVDHEKTGFLFASECSFELKNVLSRIMDNPGLASRVGSAGRECVRDRDWSRVVRVFETRLGFRTT